MTIYYLQIMLSGKGMIIGCYEGEEGSDGMELTETGQKINEKLNGKINHLLKMYVK